MTKLIGAARWAVAALGVALASSPFAAILGWQDQSTTTSTWGWSCDSANYSRTVTVRIYRSTSSTLSNPTAQGAEYLGTASANGYRADLGGVCGGIYVHAFTYNYPTSANNGQAYYVYATAVTTSGAEQLLTNSPLYTAFPAGLNKLPLGFQDDVQLNTSSRMQVTGWACDPDIPAAAATVEIYASRSNLANPVTQGATFLGTAVASGYNASLANYPQYCARTTNHNYAFVLPNNMHDGNIWYVWTYVRDSAGGPSAKLGNAPLSRTFPNLLPLGYQDDIQLNASNRMQVIGWACDPTLPSAAMTVDIYASRTSVADPLTQGAINVGSVVANGYNASLANYPEFCARTTNHNFTYVLPDSIHDGTTWYVYAYVRDSTGGTAARLWNTPLSRTLPNVAVAYSAKYVSEVIPPFFEIGIPTQISITMLNNGSATWRPGEIFLGTQGPQDNKYWCLQNPGINHNRMPLSADVRPGSAVTLTFSVLPGTCADTFRPLIFKMISPLANIGTFGEQTVDQHVSVGIPATFVSQQVPSTMKPGATAQVTVSMANTGVEQWTAASLYRLGSQNPESNLTWGKSRIELPGTVSPGQTAVFAFSITAPMTESVYNFQWQMVHDGVRWFGNRAPNLNIRVIADPPSRGALPPGSPPPFSPTWNPPPNNPFANTSY